MNTTAANHLIATKRARKKMEKKMGNLSGMKEEVEPLVGLSNHTTSCNG
jgi:hypothetical protein